MRENESKKPELLVEMREKCGEVVSYLEQASKSEFTNWFNERFPEWFIEHASEEQIERARSSLFAIFRAVYALFPRELHDCFLESNPVASWIDGLTTPENIVKYYCMGFLPNGDTRVLYRSRKDITPKVLIGIDQQEAVGVRGLYTLKPEAEDPIQYTMDMVKNYGIACADDLPSWDLLFPLVCKYPELLSSDVKSGCFNEEGELLVESKDLEKYVDTDERKIFFQKILEKFEASEKSKNGRGAILDSASFTPFLNVVYTMGGIDAMEAPTVKVLFPLADMTNPASMLDILANMRVCRPGYTAVEFDLYGAYGYRLDAEDEESFSLKRSESRFNKPGLDIGSVMAAFMGVVELYGEFKNQEDTVKNGDRKPLIEFLQRRYEKKLGINFDANVEVVLVSLSSQTLFAAAKHATDDNKEKEGLSYSPENG